MSSTHEKWPLVLYRKSVLKQQKVNQITALLGPTAGLQCLDVGGDNGVVSYLLRSRGGEWKSADLSETAVTAIRELVGNSVYQIDGRRTPFDENEFDRIVVVDFLEHIPTDAEFAEELFRILKPGGELILNVPHLKDTLLRKVRHRLGETDEKHGHVRPGYTSDSLGEVLQNRFHIVCCTTYSKFFSEAIDTLLNFGYEKLSRSGTASSKGLIVTGKDLDRHRKMFALYSLVYPLLWLAAKLDSLLFWTSGYMLIAKAKVNKPARHIHHRDTEYTEFGN